MLTWLTEELGSTEREFMEQLYFQFKSLMFLTAEKYTKVPQDRDDVIQASLEKLVKKASLLQTMERCALSSYIVYTVKHTAIDLRRKQDRTGQWELPLVDPELFSEEGLRPAEDSLLSREQLISLRRVLAGLSPTDRLLIEGKYILGYDDKELARQLGCNTNSIRMMLTRVRRRVLEQLPEEMRGL